MQRGKSGNPQGLQRQPRRLTPTARKGQGRDHRRPPTAARVRLPPRPPQTPRQRQQRQPRPFFDNLTTPPAQRRQRPAKGQRRRARLTGAPATATAATGAARTATAARTTRHQSRPHQRQRNAARKGHARSTDRPTPATPPQGLQTGRKRAPRDAAKVQHQPVVICFQNF